MSVHVSVKKFKNAKIHEVHMNPQASLPDTCILYVGPLLATSEPYSRGVGENWYDMRPTAGLVIQDILQNICIERALGLGWMDQFLAAICLYTHL